METGLALAQLARAMSVVVLLTLVPHRKRDSQVGDLGKPLEQQLDETLEVFCRRCRAGSPYGRPGFAILPRESAWKHSWCRWPSPAAADAVGRGRSAAPLGLFPVGFARRRKACPVVGRMAALEHFLEYGVGITLAAR